MSQQIFKNKDPKSKYFMLCVPIISAATIQLSL